MSEIRQKERKSPSDYKTRFKFTLMVGNNNIICARYFQIYDFNPLSLGSQELTNTIRSCAQMIDEDLKSKSRVYMWHMAPLVFKTEEEMRNWFEDPYKKESVRVGETIAIRDKYAPEYMWDGEKLVVCGKKIADSTFTSELTDADRVTYKLAFYVDEREVISTVFEGVYPFFIRRDIDLSNTKGQFKGDDRTKLGFDSYILNCLVVDRPDLIKRISKEISVVCSEKDNDYYTTSETYDKVKYPLNLTDKVMYANYREEMAKAKKYIYGGMN
jgi:hypothetical protein